MLSFTPLYSAVCYCEKPSWFIKPISTISSPSSIHLLCRYAWSRFLQWKKVAFFGGFDEVKRAKIYKYRTPHYWCLIFFPRRKQCTLGVWPKEGLDWNVRFEKCCLLINAKFIGLVSKKLQKKIEVGGKEKQNIVKHC